MNYGNLRDSIVHIITSFLKPDKVNLLLTLSSVFPVHCDVVCVDLVQASFKVAHGDLCFGDVAVAGTLCGRDGTILDSVRDVGGAVRAEVSGLFP